MDNDSAYEEEFTLEFSDRTLNEGEGEFEKVTEIMVSSGALATDWMLRTNSIMLTPTGQASLILHFFNNGDVYIMGYQASMPDVYYNPDIQYLSMWTQDHGWNVPKAHQDIVRDNLPFWKHFWETRLIDCNFLDKKFGKRLEMIEEEQSE